MRVSVLLVLALGFALPGKALAKPQPPEELLGIFSEFSEVEQKFEAGRWEGAIASLGDVSNEFREMAPELKKNVDGKVVTDFGFVLKSLQTALRNEDRENATRSYIVLQGLFFGMMDAYEYEIHPILLIIDKYLEEAAEAAEQRDFPDVSGEMAEIGYFFEKAGPLWKQRGARAGQLEQFGSLVARIREAAEERDGPAAEAGVRDLRSLFDDLLALYRG